MYIPEHFTMKEVTAAYNGRAVLQHCFPFIKECPSLTFTSNVE
jgi:hypothetical protein